MGGPANRSHGRCQKKRNFIVLGKGEIHYSVEQVRKHRPGHVHWRELGPTATSDQLWRSLVEPLDTEPNDGLGACLAWFTWGGTHWPLPERPWYGDMLDDGVIRPGVSPDVPLILYGVEPPEMRVSGDRDANDGMLASPDNE